MGLFHDLKCCRQWLCEDCRFIRQCVRDGVKVNDWQREALGHRTIAPVDAKRCTVRAVGNVAAGAGWAAAASCVDLADNPSTAP